ncbi:hypothetical protein PybrP1_006731 [[Pythium] brassicae (nom. inval.)]|nr:hypothetical protein PybrP1_006731 [[Pythium] brassicae (nom. inval.)]
MAAAADEDEHASTLRLLLSTDNHLGYAEKDPVRGDDSFRTFQEILRLAQREAVDLLLLGGDLFHDAKPSRKAMYQAMSLLRSHCMGDGAVRFQVVSDQSINFPNFGVVNYEDPNYNVALPVFSIHGNHDDPSREGGGGSSSAQQSLAALDLLSAANLVNYFGKSDKVDAIEVFPILLVKGATRVAIYGLGNMRDERLNRMFAQQKVVFRRPAEDPERWFSIFVVHQNRDDRGRGAKNCIPESFIPDFIDFVVWGHEHECLIDVQESVKGDFYITQPGSSVATSLVEGEAKPKQVAVLEVRGQNFRMTKRALATVRPFKMSDVTLSELEELDPDDPDVADRIHDALEARVHALLRDAEDEQREQPPAHPELKQVLVRLRVEHTGFPVLHNQRFGSRFVGKVANPNDILLFYRRKRDRVFALDKDGAGLQGKKDVLSEPIRPTRLDTVTIEDILQRKLHLPDQQLVFLPEKPLALALEQYVVKNVASALDEFVTAQLEETQHELGARLADTRSKHDIMSVVGRKKEQVDAEHLLDDEQQRAAADNDGAAASVPDTPHPSDGFSQSLRAQAARELEDAAVGRSRGRFGTPRKAAAAAAAATPARRKASVMDSLMDDSDDDDASDAAGFMDSPKQSKPKAAAAARGRGKAPAAVKAKPPARAAAAFRKKPSREWVSDDDDDDFSVPDDNDGDDDYEQVDEDDSERTQPQPTARGKKRPPAAAARTRAPKKRLRQRQSDDESDDNAGVRGISSDDDAVTRAPARRSRAAPAASNGKKAAASKPWATKRGASQASAEIDLCSSDDAPAPATKRKPQPKINELFQRQQAASARPGHGHDDDVESDSEFTQLTAQNAKRPESDASQSQSQASQAFGAPASRRKLPLSMVAASQGSSQSSSARNRDADAGSSLRKGWGRSRQ